MEKIRKLELVQQGLDNLVAEYTKEVREPGVHVSDLIFCLTKSYFEKKSPLAPTPDEVLLFAIGLGLQRVLIPPYMNSSTITRDGIICSPDYNSRDGKAELKTTRIKYGKEELPDTWIEQIMAYCYVSNQTSYDLLILHLMGTYSPPFPKLDGWELKFTEEEITRHWFYLLSRKEVLVKTLNNNEVPEPYKYCKEFECKSCRYSLRCEAINMVKEL